MTTVEPGQIWEDNDWRSAGRRILILSVDETHATVQSPSGMGRITRIRLDRFRPNSTGYRMTTPPVTYLDARRGREGDEMPEEGAMTEHKWTDVRGWGGALAGTLQCDHCNRVASPTDPKRADLLASECKGRTR